MFEFIFKKNKKFIAGMQLNEINLGMQIEIN